MNNTFDLQVKAITAGSISVTAAADEIFAQLTEDEKLWMLDGDLGFKDFMVKFGTEGYCYHPHEAGVVDRLGIPGIRFSDGPRGVLLGSKCTTFPVSSSRAATFNPGLEEEVVSCVTPRPIRFGSFPLKIANLSGHVLRILCTIGYRDRKGTSGSGRQLLWRCLRKPRPQSQMGTSSGILRRGPLVGRHHGSCSEQGGVS
jgi:hypothetical protein